MPESATELSVRVRIHINLTVGEPKKSMSLEAQFRPPFRTILELQWGQDEDEAGVQLRQHHTPSKRPKGCMPKQP